MNRVMVCTPGQVTECCSLTMDWGNVKPCGGGAGEFGIHRGILYRVFRLPRDG